MKIIGFLLLASLLPGILGAKENTEMNITDIIVHAGLTRMRPILMTTLTSVLGFMPMALAIGTNGAEMMQPLAVSLVGGLTIGTLLTLFIIPAIYSIFEDKKQRKLIRKAQ